MRGLRIALAIEALAALLLWGAWEAWRGLK